MSRTTIIFVALLYGAGLTFFMGGPVFLMELEGLVPDRTHANTFGLVLSVSADIEASYHNGLNRLYPHPLWDAAVLRLPITPLEKINDLYWDNVVWWMQWHKYGNFPPYLRAT